AAASDGDTVFLASGNWALTSTHQAVVVTKALHVVGAGSGNTFDIYGHPNNTNGNAINATTSNGITRIFTTGAFTGCSFDAQHPQCTSARPGGPGGSLQFGIASGSTNCVNVSLEHMAVDGSVGYSGGDRFAPASFLSCQGPGLVNDIRSLSFGSPTLIGAGETQFNVSDVSQNITIQNSVFSEPAIIDGNGNYPGTQAFQITDAINITLNNDYFYQIAFSPIAMNNTLYTGTQTFVGQDGVGNGAAWYNQVMGLAGCPIGPNV